LYSSLFPVLKQFIYYEREAGGKRRGFLGERREIK